MRARTAAARLFRGLLVCAVLFIVTAVLDQGVLKERGTIHAQTPRGEPIRCTVTISTATTIQAVGGDCAAKPGLRLTITDILFATNAGAIAADSFNTLKYGTGTTCGTGTTVFWGAMTTAATQATVIQQFQTPIILPVNVDVCWINSTAGSKFIVITGYYTP